jgi:hypothetical protein
MRSYSGFLLLEDVLDFAPTDNGDLYNFLQKTIRPTVKLVEEDCLTKIGRSIDVNFEIQGFKELATDLPITRTRINDLLAVGQYFVAIRSLYSCVSKDGICRACYNGSYIDQTAPAVGSFTRLEPEYNFQTDLIVGTGITTVFTLSQSSDTYTRVLLVKEGVIQTGGYSVSGSTLTLDTALPQGDHLVVKFMKTTAQPYVGYLARTYTGSLLGMQSLTTQNIIIRPSLAQSLFTDEELNLAKGILESSYRGIVTSNFIDYIDTMQDKLERAIFISLLYGLYSNVRT